jgi:hypothetical protein
MRLNQRLVTRIGAGKPEQPRAGKLCRRGGAKQIGLVLSDVAGLTDVY